MSYPEVEQDIWQTTGTFLLCLAIVFAVGYLYVKVGLPKQERYECEKWAQEAKEYAGYYLLDWQIEQCNHHGYETIIPRN